MPFHLSEKEYIAKFREVSKEIWFSKYFPELGSQTVEVNSDKNFINDMKLMKDDQKEFVTCRRIVNHIKAIPSERRFNILSKLFNFKSFNDEEKAKIISVCFLTGKGKLFRRSLNLFSDNVLTLLPASLEHSYNYEFINNNISHNMKILKNYLPEEQFNFLVPVLFKGLQAGHVNSLFCSHLNNKISDKDKERLVAIVRRKIYDAVNHDNKHHIDINSENFINFYNDHLQGDNSLLIDIIIGAKTNIIPFIKGIYDNNRSIEALYNKNLGSYSYKFFEQMVMHFIHNPDTQEKMNSFDKYFQTISVADESLFLNIMNEIGTFIQDSSPILYMENKIMSFKRVFKDSLNSRIGNPDIQIANYESKSYKDIMSEYRIKQEQQMILQQLNIRTGDADSKVIKRL